ncbi:MAG: hypothetical protein KDD99_04455 [Bacteroidetes bacterium]|nr:hypothetical protein [Bacteroidota bacterium]
MIFVPKLHSQIYQGYEVSNYAGVIGLDFQPASIVDNRNKLDILVGGFGSSVENNIIKLDIETMVNFQHSQLSDYLTGESAINIDDDGFIKIQNQINFLSLMASPSKYWGIGFQVKARNFAQVEGFSSQTAEVFIDEISNITGPGYFPDNPFRYQSSSFFETGFTLGGGFDHKAHAFRFGITGNYLAGIDFLDLNVRQLDLNITSPEAIEVNLDLTYARSPGIHLPIGERLSQLDLSQHNGYSLNMGFVYEFRPRYKNHFYGPMGLPQERQDWNKYHLKIGASIKDWGQISYETSTQNTIFIDSTIVNPEQLTLDNSEQLEDILAPLNQSGQISAYPYALQTQLNAYVDLRITQTIYLNLAYRSILDIQGQQILFEGNPWFSAIPRIESNVAEFGIPIRVTGNREALVGAYLRVGPLLIGTGSVGSLLLPKRRGYRLNAYAALRVPLNHRKP